MNTNRYSKISAGLLIVVIALASVSFVTLDRSANKISVNTRSISNNTYLPLAPGKQTLLFNAARGSGDFYQRHQNWSWSAASASAVEYQDYAQRHPELSAKADTSIDTSDYYFRHLGQ